MTVSQQPPKWLRILTSTLLAGMLVIALLAFISTHFGWWIGLELASHFQVQYAIAATFLFIGLLITRQKVACLVGLFCLALLLTNLLPWYLPNGNRTIAGTPLRVLIANLNTKNRQYPLVLSLIQQEQPDVIVLMEVSDQWINQLEPLQSRWTHRFGLAADHNFGIAVFSRLPLQQPEIAFFGSANIPSIVTKLSLQGRSLTLIATHPLPPIQPDIFDQRNAQLADVADYVQSIEPPVILAGDLNLSMWSPYYRRLVNKTGLVNTRKGFGILPSWPTPGTYGRDIPALLLKLMSIPIDHCLVSPALGVAHIHIGSPTGSDHLPVIVDLTIPTPSK